MWLHSCTGASPVQAHTTDCACAFMSSKPLVPSSYWSLSMQREDYPKSYEDWYFILLSKCNACGIEGEGRVDGQGSLWASGG